jgi:hypothetical protein
MRNRFFGWTGMRVFTWHWSWISVRFVNGSRAQVGVSRHKVHLQAIVSTFNMDIFPDKVIEGVPTISWNSQLCSIRCLVSIIWDNNQFDFPTMTIG